MPLFFKRKEKIELDRTNIPAHIAIIMDGNGRWAQKRGLPRAAGHSAGSETFRRAAEHMNELGVKYFTVYAFSTENWSRPKDEVDSIMQLLEKYLHEAIRDMEKKNISLRFFGDVLALPKSLRALVDETSRISLKTDGLQVNVCLNYGGRSELVRAARMLAEQCASGRMNVTDIDENAMANCMYSAGIPDPDLMIRPGGEVRLSNFLLWQNAYSEFYFTDTLWPDVDERVLDGAIAEYQRRRRRFGGVR